MHHGSWDSFPGSYQHSNPTWRLVPVGLIQSRSQSPRYPCPAERENEDLWNTAFELDISLANNRACAIVPEVRKTIILFPDFQIKPPAIDVETLGTTSSSANMADKTPVKPLALSVSQQYVCRCCNSSFANNPVDLFGPKSQSENLLSIVVNVTGLSVCESDCLPEKICRNCHTRLKQFSEFKDLCQRSRTEQESSREGRRWKKVLLRKNSERQSGVKRESNANPAQRDKISK